MLEFLPEENKKEVKKEYFWRFVIAGLVLSLVLFVISGALLVPSYVLSETKENVAVLNLKNSEMGTSTQSDTVSTQEFSSFKKDLALLKPDTSATPPSEVIAPALADQPKGITLTSLVYVQQSGDTLGTLEIIGTAKERTVLVNYVKTLEAEKLFQSVEYPISNLASENDINFSIKAIGKF